MLYWIDNKHPVTEIPRVRKRFYESGLSRLSNCEQLELIDYINQMIDDSISNNNNTQFMVPGWKAKGIIGDKIFNLIWGKACGKNQELSALWYGLLVFYVMIQRDDVWYVTKTNFNRPFDQAVYWKKELAGI